MRPFRTFLILLGLGLLCPPATAADRPPVRAGLFIGIGKYGDEERSGCRPHPELRRSAERLHQLMLERGRLDPNRTRLVTDEQATRADLEQLLVRWLPSVTQPGDTVFIFFSGHAGRIPNQDGTEPDGEDELLCPYDQDGAHLGGDAGMARIRATAILDSTLARWLTALAGRQIVLILDTCHSGGIVENNGLVQRFRDDNDRAKDISNLIVLTGCAADEQSLIEGSPSGTMWFTHFLMERIITTDRPLTVQAAHQHCRDQFRKLLRKRREIQEPTLTDTILLPVRLVP